MFIGWEVGLDVKEEGFSLHRLLTRKQSINT
jgi:hypothetical protein